MFHVIDVLNPSCALGCSIEGRSAQPRKRYLLDGGLYFNFGLGIMVVELGIAPEEEFW